MKYLFPLIIVLISLALGWQFFRPGYFSMDDDLQVMRLYQMDRCFQDGQIPCRWSPDMANNYGQAMFNYYSVFPYYLGQFIHQLGFSYIVTVKILFLLSLVLSGLFVYAFVSQLTIKTAAFFASIVYLTTPYRALDIFVRGAMSEIWGMTLMAAVLATLIWFIRNPSTGKFALLSFSIATFLTSHNLTVFISLPFLIITFILIWFLFSQNRRQDIFLLGGATLLGIGLSAFFTLPLIFERNLIQTQLLTSDYFNFQGHFVSLKQLFFNFSWGYGSSQFGSHDDMSFAIGIVNSLALIVTPISIFFLIKTRNIKQLSLLVLFYIGLIFSIFMTHNKSTFIWESIPLLSFVQFPWRFLGLAMLTSSLALGLQFSLLSKRVATIFLISLILFIVSFNFHYFRFEKYLYGVNDSQKLSGKAYNSQVGAAITDYLPQTVKKIPKKIAPRQPQILNGSGDVTFFDKRSLYFVAEIDIASKSAVLQFPIMYFPNWTLFRDRNATPIPISYDNDLGLITITLPKGHHLIQAWFKNTPIRTIGNMTTFISVLILLSLFVVKQKPGKNQRKT